MVRGWCSVKATEPEAEAEAEVVAEEEAPVSQPAITLPCRRFSAADS